MPRKKNPISQTRGILYGLAKFLGDISAVSKGPEATAKRLGRRAAGKATGRLLGRLFK
ncbi:MAG: hypothetical protein KGZ75_03735 [Syntrophomonadaceae bacterium]|nr:hypothetical protein [Syntrophomonadaceae bacterium]